VDELVVFGKRRVRAAFCSTTAGIARLQYLTPLLMWRDMARAASLAVPEGKDSPFAFPASTVVFHWHGDTFSLPPGGVWLARSAGCEHQAFAVGAHVLGLQFHVEMKPLDVARIAKECAGELTPGLFVQPAETIIARASVEGGGTAALLDELLGRLEQG